MKELLKFLFTTYNEFVLILTLGAYIINHIIFNRIIIKRNNNLTYLFLFNFIKVVIVIIGIFLFLIQYNHFEKILITLISNSALIVATLGFALQSTIKNILAGFMLLSSDAFKVGDRIRLQTDNLIGTIQELNLRHTTIKLANNEVAIIPNTLLNEAIVINNNLIKDYSVTGYPLIIPIKSDKDIRKAMKIIEKAIEDNPNILNKEQSSIVISNVETDKIEFKVLIWTDNIEDSFKEITNLKIEILEEFQKNKLI